MTVVVCSDIHGRTDRLAALLAQHRRADAFLFLGDGVRDLPDAVLRSEYGSFAGVRGNCDRLSELLLPEFFPEERLLRLGTYTVMMMHGHTHSVKYGADDAIRAAAAQGADLLLYGHTHTPEERYLAAGTQVGERQLQKPLWVFNPGSLGAPRSGSPSYGIIELRSNGILLSHGTLP